MEELGKCKLKDLPEFLENYRLAPANDALGVARQLNNQLERVGSFVSQALKS